MTLPTRDDAAGWIGHRVNDSDGVEIGTCIKIYADDDTEALEWIGVGLHGGANAVVPIGGATEAGGAVTVVFTQESVLRAPVAASLDFLSREDEVSLYEHYGVPYTSAASTTTLPLGEDPQADLEAAASEPEESVDAAPPTTQDEPTPAAAGVASASTQATSDESAQTGAKTGRLTRLAPASGPPPSPDPTVAPPQSVPSREPWPVPEPLPTSRVVPALVVGGAVVAGAAAVRWLPIRRQPPRRAPASTLLGLLHRIPPAAPRLDRLTELDIAGLARRAGSGALHAAMVPSAYGTLAVQRTAGAVRQLAPRAGGAVQQAGQSAVSGANRVVATTAETASATLAGITGGAESIYDTWRTTMGLLKNSIIFGGGYVLGTRAGREQYEVIKAKASELAQSPTVQQATGKVKGAVTQKLPGRAGRQGYDTTTSSYRTSPPATVPVPPAPPINPTATGIEDPVVPPSGLTIDLTDDVPSTTERLT